MGTLGYWGGQMAIDGTWYNELGSTMTITTSPEGTVAGQYVSLVGDAPGSYDLVGRFDSQQVPGEVGTTVGWSVAWQNETTDVHSVTVWAGQYFDGGSERIMTTWLLDMQTSPENLWESTVVGQDMFGRIQPTPQEVQNKLRLGAAASHPLRQRP